MKERNSLKIDINDIDWSDSDAGDDVTLPDTVPRVTDETIVFTEPQAKAVATGSPVLDWSDDDQESDFVARSKTAEIVADVSDDPVIETGQEEPAEAAEQGEPAEQTVQSDGEIAGAGTEETASDEYDEYDVYDEDEADDEQPEGEQTLGLRRTRELDTTKADYFNSLSDEDKAIYLKLQKAKREQRLRKRRLRQGVTLILAVLLIFGGYKAVKAISKYHAEQSAKHAAYEEMIKAGNETTDGDNELVKLAVGEIGNEGGKKYWTWWGYEVPVNWDTIFVSWLGDHVSSDISSQIPRFVEIADGVEYYKDAQKWLDGGKLPLYGYLIFFDYANDAGERDGKPDHVGIVTGTFEDRVFTIEGNIGYSEHNGKRDAGSVDWGDDFKGYVGRRGYDVDDPDICGYGVIGEFPVFDEDL